MDGLGIGTLFVHNVSLRLRFTSVDIHIASKKHPIVSDSFVNSSCTRSHGDCKGHNKDEN